MKINYETNHWNDYELIDSGDGRKLERYGEYIISRPAPQALWPPELSKSSWETAHAIYHRSSSGGGRWEYLISFPERYTISWSSLTFIIKLTGFGHVGLFPEQSGCWEWLRNMPPEASDLESVLNLFAYTGAATVAAVSAGNSVCHVDGSKGSVTWARENAVTCHMESRSIRWIVDDVNKFVAREIKRDRTYRGIILDPPTFGRGPKGQVWKIEDDLPKLFEMIRHFVSQGMRFIIFTCHSPSVSIPVLRNLFEYYTEGKGHLSTGDLLIKPTNGQMKLPAGIAGI
ncbi:class I SAM-dependent methyltransferase, partial [bacterium]|nr:class I SAM-dependent methyltransferase [candidate division CSSED10-310 bacterium]